MIMNLAQVHVEYLCDFCEAYGCKLILYTTYITSEKYTLRQRQNGRKFPDIFKCIFLNENI